MSDKINSLKKDGVSYYQLFIKCPVCNERGVNTAPSFWTHAADDGDIYIGDNAKYHCTTCGTTENIMKWGYRCPVHSNANNKDEYIEVHDPAVIADVVSAAGQLVKIAGIPWLQELLKNL